jgi:hypothetical protein
MTSGSGPGGRRFKSFRPDHLFSEIYDINIGQNLDALVFAQVLQQKLPQPKTLFCTKLSALRT